MSEPPPLESTIALSIQLVIAGTIISLLNVLLWWALSNLGIVPDLYEILEYIIVSSYLCSGFVLYISYSLQCNLEE